MLRVFIFCVILVALAWLTAPMASADEPSIEPTRVVLNWHNGDYLPGSIVSADREKLTWKSELFVDPLQLRRDALRSIRWQNDQPSQLARKSYRATTIDGDLIVGDLLSVDSQLVKLRNASIGEIALERTKVRSLVNLSTTKGRWQGPLWLEDWDGTVESKSSYFANAQGQLKTSAIRNPLFKKIQFAPNTLIDVAFRWDGKLDLKFAFAAPKKWGKLVVKSDSKTESAQSASADSFDSANKQDGSDMVVVSKDLSILDQAPRLEMFGDSLVLQQKELFDIILEQVDLSSGYLRLLFYWNVPGNQLRAYDSSGKLLATISMETLSEDFEPGIVILNQADNLTIDQLVIRSLPNDYTVDQANTQRELIAATPETVIGSVEGFDGINWSLRRSSDDTLKKVPAADFCSAHAPFLPETPAKTTATEQPMDRDTKIVLCDGTRLIGRCQKITNNSLHLQSSIAKQELIVRLDRAEQIDFPNTAWQGEQSDTPILESANARCHGWLTSDPNKPSVVQWKAIGSDTAGVMTGVDFRILRTASQTPKSNAPKLYRDRLYLRNGDCFPANILGLQSGELQVEAFNQTIAMPVDTVLRCLMDVPVPSASQSLDNLPWQIATQEGNPGNVPNVFASQGKRTVRYAYHPSLLETGSFTLVVRGMANDSKTNVVGAFDNRRLEISLFAAKPTDVGTRLYLSVYPMSGGKLFVSLDSSVGEFGASMDRALSLNASDKVECKVQLIDSELVASINGFEVVRKRLKLGPDPARGVSIMLDDQIPIEAVRQEGGYGFSSVKLSSENRELCLTQPRYVAYQSLRSIVVGHNADLWRADIVSMNDQSLVVRSGGRHIVVERKLVSSLVWPERASEPSSIGATSNSDTGNVANVLDSTDATDAIDATNTKAKNLTTVQLLMNDGMKLTLKLEGWDSQRVVGNSTHFGRIELSTQEISELRSGNEISSAADFEGQRWRFKLGKEIKTPKGGGGSKGGKGEQGEEMALAGQSAPGFKVKALNGPDIDLVSYRGKVVVLDFWATWCGYCVAELPDMVAEIGKLPADKVQLITLNQNEEAETVSAFMKKRNLHFLVGMDRDEVAPQYKVDGLPTTVVIDPEGKVVHVKVGGGEAPFAEMMQVVRKLVSENGGSATELTTTTATTTIATSTSQESVADSKKPVDRKGDAPRDSMTAKPTEKSLTEKSSAEKSSAEKNALVSIDAFIQPSRGKQPALLVIRASIADDHKVFSLTQPAGGPVKTKIKLDKSDSFTLGEFSAQQEAQKYPDPSFNNLEVEVHKGVVTWFAPLKPVANSDLESLTITGKVNMQLCTRTNCLAPRDYPFTAKLSLATTEQEFIDASKVDRQEK